MINFNILLTITVRCMTCPKKKLYTLDIEFKMYGTMLRVNIWIYILMQNV